MWIKIIGSVLTFIGVIFIYEGRRLIKKYFNYGEENVATLGMKLLGALLALTGGILCIIK